MLRIKTYVMIVGVALGASPIFNCALAQNGNNSTQLLLQVQTMREEIAQLRDMVERQDFQLKRLQAQSNEQSQQIELARAAEAAARINGTQSSYSSGALPSAQSSLNEIAEGSLTQTVEGSLVQSAEGSLSQVNGLSTQAGAVNSVGSNINQVVDIPGKLNQQLETGAASLQSTPSLYQQNAAAQDRLDGVVSQVKQSGSQAVLGSDQLSSGRIVSEPLTQLSEPLTQQSESLAKQQGLPIGSVNENYAPVVDRSFSTSAPTVPVTGAGTQLQTTIDNVTGQSVSTQVAQAAGVISIPRPSGIVATQLDRADGAIDVSAEALKQISKTEFSNAPSASAQLASTQVVAAETTAETVTGATGTAAPAPSAVVVLPEGDYYAQGFELLKQSKYEEASSIFKQQLEAYPQGDLSDDAHYWIAEAMHVSRKLDIAKYHLKVIINDYPQSRRVPDAMLKTAYIEQSQGNEIEARILFQEIVNLHPLSDAAIAARNQLTAAN